MIKLDGFIQCVTQMGIFFTRSAELHEHWVRLEGPTIIHMQIREDPKTHQVSSTGNTDRVSARWLARGGVISIDELNPASLDKRLKEVYQELVGIQLM